MATETVWVQRNAGGNVCGVFGCAQVDIVEEQLPADHPEVVAYLNPPSKAPEPAKEYVTLEQFSALQKQIEDLTKLLQSR
jgi:hypothetical protein